MKSDFIKLVASDIKTDVKKYIFLFIQITVTFFIIGFLCFMLVRMNVTNTAVRNAGIPDNYYSAKSTEVYTYGGRYINADENGKRVMLNDFIAENYQTEGATAYPMDFAENYAVSLITDGYFDIYNLKLEKGRQFTKEEYNNDNDAFFPVIMGYGFIDDYDIGDMYLDKFEVVGFLKDNQYIPELSGRISEGFPVNYNIYTPVKSTEWLKRNKTAYPDDLIYARDKSELDAINVKAEELGLYPFNFLSAKESTAVMQNTASTLDIPLVLVSAIIIVMSALCLFQIMNLFVKRNLTELLIHMMCGARLSDIIVRVGAGTLLTAFLSAGAASLIFRSAGTTAVMFITAAAVVVISLIPVAVRLKRKPLITAVKEEK